MKTPREKYINDSLYRNLVDLMVNQMHQCNYTPSEMREAAVSACIIYEEHRIRPMVIPIPKDVESALDTIHEWTTSGEKRKPS